MNNRITPAQYLGVLIGVCIFIPLVWFIQEPDVLKKMWIVVTNNSIFWITIVISILFGLYQKFSNPDTFTWLELPIQIIGSVAAIFMLFNMFFYTTTDLSDTEIWGGSAIYSEYYEEWTEEYEYESCDSEGNNCTTETTLIYHPPEWYIRTSNDEEVKISENNYNNFVKYYGNEQKEILFRIDQISIGDGNRYYVSNPGGIKPIWTAVEHPFVNYLAASKSIKLRRGGIEKFRSLLLPYPNIVNGKFGLIEVDRVLSAGVDMPLDWMNKVDEGLDYSLTTLGKQKQVNILVYVVNSADQSFLHALEEHWVYGKKNDVVVIIGSTSFPKADWVSVMAWTDIEEFKITLRNRILNLTDLSEASKLVQTITDQIKLKPENGGFLRKPMSDYEYVVADITLPWWANCIVLLLSGLFTWLISYTLKINEINNLRHRRWR